MGGGWGVGGRVQAPRMITSPRRQRSANEMCRGLAVKTEQEMLAWQVIRVRLETRKPKFPPLGLSRCSLKTTTKKKTILGEEKVPTGEGPIKYWLSSGTTVGLDTQ